MSRLTKWPSKDKSLSIKDMELSHLNNTVRILHQYAADRHRPYKKINGYETIYNARTIMEWVLDMKREIKLRKSVMFG